MNFDFSDKLVLITGGSSGIGKQIAIDCLRAGAKVIIVSENLERLQQVKIELSVVSSVGIVQCDIGDTQTIYKMRETVLNTYGCPDIIINNAGFATYRTFESSDLSEIERLVNVNLMGALRCTKVFLPEMIIRRSGTIVNMASIAGRMIITPNATYCAAKHGMVAWSEALKYELAPFNIQVNVICSGRVETAFFDHETFQKRVPRPETRYTTTVGDVSKATLQAIAGHRVMTYVPWTLGLVVGLINAFPWLVKPILGRLLLSRINTIYNFESSSHYQRD